MSTRNFILNAADILLTAVARYEIGYEVHCGPLATR